MSGGIPSPGVFPNTWDFLGKPMIKPEGFREYDARWRYPGEINLEGVTALGLGLGTQIFESGVKPTVSVGNDYREYSLAVKNALVLGLLRAGLRVHDIGTCLSPMAYFSQFHLDTSAVAMVTASHNPNGWTGVKMGMEAPLTHGPEQMSRLREIVMSGSWKERRGGVYRRVDGVKEAYMEDLLQGVEITRPLKVVCATGNGTASAFAPELLERMGVKVFPLHTELDYTFPNYNPNPESMEMLRDMAKAVERHGADIALGFDGDGDRCGVVDNTGEEIFADKVGVMLARDLVQMHPGARFVVDVKSTGLFATDPELKKHGGEAVYWKTGHSHIKRKVNEIGALAGFEKSGHYFFADPIGRGYDCGLRVAVEICRLLDRNPGQSLSRLRQELPQTYSSPTMSPHCPDEVKYGVVDRIVEKLQRLREEGGALAGRRIADILTINGARVILENGAWGLVRASSNTPNLVVVCESPESEKELRGIFWDLDSIIHSEPEVGDYDQTI